MLQLFGLHASCIGRLALFDLGLRIREQCLHAKQEVKHATSLNRPLVPIVTARLLGITFVLTFRLVYDDTLLATAVSAGL